MRSCSNTGESALIGSERGIVFAGRNRTRTELEYSSRRGKEEKGGGSETSKESDLTALTLSWCPAPQ